MFFWILITLIVIQRCIELGIARKNKQWILNQGGYEAGSEHYKYIVLLHASFFISLIYEAAILRTPELIAGWTLPFAFFCLAQVLRVWCLSSLGRFWNTRIMILPRAKVISRGPYQYIRHPNYLVVALELAVLPLMFNALFTALLFTILNAALLLLVRIPAEEKALREATNYTEQFFQEEIVKD